jgi:hypothetical protein
VVAAEKPCTKPCSKPGSGSSGQQRRQRQQQQQQRDRGLRGEARSPWDRVLQAGSSSYNGSNGRAASSAGRQQVAARQ